VVGPTPFFSIPHDVSNKQKKVLEGLMDISPGEGFFEHIDLKMYIANYAFEIKSKWARGDVEMLMVSFFAKSKKLSVFKETLQKFADNIKTTPKIYKGFYINKAKADSETPKFKNKIEKICIECYEECRRTAADQKPGKMLVIGLQATGKTSIIKRITSNIYDSKIKPTLGNQIIKSAVEKFQFRIFDVSGQKNLRKNWFKGPLPDAIVFVLDLSASTNQHKEAKKEFENMKHHYFGSKSNQKLPGNTPILILGNKKDLKHKLNEKGIHKLLNPKNINFKIGIVSALTNEGIEENFKWLISSILFA
jgi:small GTP-binding protein